MAEAGECPEDMSSFSCLQDLMRANNLYEGEPGNLARYDPKKLKILRSQTQPRPLKQLLPPHVLQPLASLEGGELGWGTRWVFPIASISLNFG